MEEARPPYLGIGLVLLDDLKLIIFTRPKATDIVPPRLDDMGENELPCGQVWVLFPNRLEGMALGQSTSHYNLLGLWVQLHRDYAHEVKDISNWATKGKS